MASGLVFMMTATLAVLCFHVVPGGAKLSPDFYDKVCPEVEKIVRGVVAAKSEKTFVTVPATIRMFFHDCFVEGCDGSILINSTEKNSAEKDHPINLSLPREGFETVMEARAALDAIPNCWNKVSCADVLALATRDAINLAGGPSYTVELGRLDGLRSSASQVQGKLPSPRFNFSELR